MIEKNDTLLHKGLRKKLVETLRKKGISNEAVLQAIETVPRHFFVPFGIEKKSIRRSSLADRRRSNHFATLYRCVSNSIA